MMMLPRAGERGRRQIRQQRGSQLLLPHNHPGVGNNLKDLSLPLIKLLHDSVLH